MILYHITPHRKVKSILRGGLVPPTYLSNKRDLNKWVLSRLIDVKDFPNNWFYDGSQIYKRSADIAPEYIVGERIHQSRVKLLQILPVRETVNRGIKERWLMQVLRSGKEVRPKWKSRKRKQFARFS